MIGKFENSVGWTSLHEIRHLWSDWLKRFSQTNMRQIAILTGHSFLFLQTMTVPCIFLKDRGARNATQIAEENHRQHGTFVGFILEIGI